MIDEESVESGALKAEAGYLRDRERDRNEAEPRPVIGDAFERGSNLAGSLADAVDAKGRYYPSHARGVEQIARSIAEFLSNGSSRFTAAHIARIALAALLHDTGKLMIPDRVLLKAEDLTEGEFSTIRQHVVWGEQIMIAAGYGDEALWVRHHHCRWDGQGYPDKLKGEQIPIESRIICVADAFHAMQTDRPYNRARSVGWALAEIASKAGSQFDPAVAEAVLGMAKAR